MNAFRLPACPAAVLTLALALALLGLGAPSSRAQTANDNFGTPQVLPSAGTGNVAGSNADATAEPGEPAHLSGQPARRSLWYLWRAPGTGNVTFTTRGSSFDTLLAAYSGTNLVSLRQLASNDDSNSTVQSEIIFAVTAGTDYRVAVDGYGGAFGSIQLSWSLPGPPVFREAPAPTTAVEGGLAQFSVTVDSSTTVQYLWYRNGTEIPGSRTNFLAFAPVSLADAEAVFLVTASNRYGAVTSAPVTLTVVRDTTPPSVVRAFNYGPTNVFLVFNEPIAPGSVRAPGTFSVGRGVTVVGAALEPDGLSVRIHVSPLVFDAGYTVTLSGVTDAADRPNAVAPGTSVQFTARELSVAVVGLTGSTGTLGRPAPGAWTLSGAGTGISGGLDQFQFASGERTGDFDVQVRVESLGVTTPSMQAGLMARFDGTPGAPFAGVFASTPQLGSFFESRNSPGVNTVTATVPGGFPSALPDGWLRLRRVGNVLTGFAGFDGRTWTRLGSVETPLPDTLRVGLALSGETASRTATAAFRDYGTTASSAESAGPPTDTREPLGPASRRTGMVISEIMYADGPVAGTNSVEFIEFYNAGSIFEDLSGWRVEGEVRYTFPAGTRLEAGTFLVLAGDPAGFE